MHALENPPQQAYEQPHNPTLLAPGAGKAPRAWNWIFRTSSWWALPEELGCGRGLYRYHSNLTSSVASDAVVSATDTIVTEITNGEGFDLSEVAESAAYIAGRPPLMSASHG